MSELGREISGLLKEEVIRTAVPSGLNVCILRKKGFNKKYAVLATRFGSIDLRFHRAGSSEVIEVPYGTAHFLEHKLFEEEDGSIDQKFADLGASANAFTNHTMTGYLFSATDRFEESLATLIDFVYRPYFTDENVEKEKGIIEQEIRMGEDDPRSRGIREFLESMYHTHPVRYDPAGTVESIHRIDKDVLYGCYEAFYHPCNMTLFLLGDIDAENAVSQVQEKMGSKQFGPGEKPHHVYPDEPTWVRTGESARVMPVSSPMLWCGYKDPTPPGRGKPLERRLVAAECLMEMIIGRSSPLFNELYEEGLIDDRFDWGVEMEEGFGFVLMSGKTPDPGRVWDRISRAAQGVAEHGVDSEDFERVRRTTIGAMLRGFNSLEFIAYNFLTYHFRGISLLDRVQAASEITPEHVSELARHLFHTSQAVKAVVGPPRREQNG